MKKLKFKKWNYQAVSRGCGIVIAILLLTLSHAAAQEPAKSPEPRLIEVVADHDSRYRIAGHANPTISVTAGEKLRLRITAIKAKNHDREGAVHGFSLLGAKDHKPVPGWDFSLQPGTQEFMVTAPEEPGDYEVVCTVICSSNHDQMKMKFIVLPQARIELDLGDVAPKGRKMATIVKPSISALCFILFLLLCPITRGGDEVFIGTIADSQCALNVHSLSQSHKEMLESKSVGTTEAECVWYCITERGGHFVLQNKSKVYKLDKQDFSRQFAASKVKITGTLDPQTNTIHVHSVELLSSSGQPSTAPK